MKRITLVALTAFFASSMAAQDAPQSPFQAPRPQASQEPQVDQPTPLDSFEFNGIMQLGGRTRISVYDTNARRNYWLEEGQSGDSGLKLQRYDAQNETIIIARGGVMKKLSLKQAQIEPLRITSQPATPDPALPVVDPATRPAGSVAESDEEVRERMQRVAEEIRRRRAERRQRMEERRDGAGNE